MFQPDPELQLPVKRQFNRRVFAIIWAVAMLGVLLGGIIRLVPLEAANLARGPLSEYLPVLVAFVIALRIVINGVFYGGVAWLGYLLAREIGLGMPFVEKAVQGTAVWHRLPTTALLAAFLGILAGLFIVASEVVLFAPQNAILPNPQAEAASEAINPTTGLEFLVPFLSGLTMEVLLRLLGFSLLAFLGRPHNQDAEGRPGLVALWAANLAVTPIFVAWGVSQLVASGVPLTLLDAARGLVQNGVIGVIAGWLYWTRGLESAMIAHFTADVVVYLLLSAGVAALI